jgi:DNA-directed RNA polymerase specialized sigma24 family protein
MSLLANLAPHLPYVRRYARALTGDQAVGDAYVRAALEAIGTLLHEGIDGVRGGPHAAYRPLRDPARDGR